LSAGLPLLYLFINTETEDLDIRWKAAMVFPPERLEVYIMNTHACTELTHSKGLLSSLSFSPYILPFTFGTKTDKFSETTKK
jgi:hypothetical protein